jgi:hypothetical protein
LHTGGAGFESRLYSVDTEIKCHENPSGDSQAVYMRITHRQTRHGEATGHAVATFHREGARRYQYEELFTRTLLGQCIMFVLEPDRRTVF